MLFKLIKHDFRYSARLFLALGAIAIAIAAIVAATDVMQAHQVVATQNLRRIITSTLGLWVVPPVAIAAIIHIGQFYRKGMFGRVGHLVMTMPVSRGALLISKLIVAFVWFLFALLVGLAMIAVIYFVSPQLYSGEFGPGFIQNIGMLPLVLEIICMGLFAISLLFFCITLSHTAFANMRISHLISSAIWLLWAVLYLWAYNMLSLRFMPIVEEIRRTADGTLISQSSRAIPLTGLQYGRIVIGEETVMGFMPFTTEVFIDILFIAFSLATTAVTVVATRALLKNHISI